IPSPLLPLILSPPLPVSSSPPASPIRPLGYRAAMIRLRAEAASTSHSPLSYIILSHTKPGYLTASKEVRHHSWSLVRSWRELVCCC
ncbi:hypothetical protein Tco_0495546, partial [Tanacetum coccineum]